ncbi:MAG: M20 family metallopeptidase [Anaerolineae bacterium]
MLAQSRGGLPNIALMAVGDESGGVYSSRYLLNTVRDLHGAVAILPDGGTNWHIVRESKGLLHLAIDIHGVSGHASRPWKGINAIDRTAQIVQAIRHHYPEPSAATWDTTVTFSQIESGSPSERNKIPGTAMLFLDVRYPNEVPPETIISRIERTARTVDPGAAVRRVVTKAPFLLTQAPLIERWKALIQGKQTDAIYIQEEGTADHVYFAEHGIPAIVTAPRGGDAHSDSEWIDLNSMMEYGEVLYTFLAQNAK